MPLKQRNETDPSAMNRMWHKVNFLKLNTVGLYSDFLLDGSHTRVKEPRLPYYLLITGGRLVGFMSFINVLAQSKLQTALSRIWTWVAYLISSDN